jgi:hypothetical protein
MHSDAVTHLELNTPSRAALAAAEEAVRVEDRLSPDDLKRTETREQYEAEIRKRAVLGQF